LYGVLVDLLTEKSVAVRLTSQFGLVKFDLDDFKSLLFYMGYATLESYSGGLAGLRIPNYVICTLFADCFYAIGHRNATDADETARVWGAFRQLSEQGDLSALVAVLERDLGHLSNRIYERFDEKYIQIVAYMQATRYTPYIPVLEREQGGGYADLLLLERSPGSVRWNALIEFNYIRKQELSGRREKREAVVAGKRDEAYAQISRYREDPALAELDRAGRLKKFILLFSRDECVLFEEVV